MTPTFASDCDVIDVDNTENDISDDSRGEDSDAVLMEEIAGTKTVDIDAEPSEMKDNHINSRPPGVGANLTSEEEEATKKFLENVNKWRSARQLEEGP